MKCLLTFHFRTNGEMPKRSPSLRYENIEVFSWTLYVSLIDLRLGNNLFMKVFKRKVFNLSKSPHAVSVST